MMIIQVDWSKMTEDSASVADKIKKKLHIQSKSGLEKFQVIVTVHNHCQGMVSGHLLFRNGVPRTFTLLVDSLEVFSSA